MRRCCCQWGAAIGKRHGIPSGEWPEGPCAGCETHGEPGDPPVCRYHKRVVHAVYMIQMDRHKVYLPGHDRPTYSDPFVVEVKTLCNRRGLESKTGTDITCEECIKIAAERGVDLRGG